MEPRSFKKPCGLRTDFLTVRSGGSFVQFHPTRAAVAASVLWAFWHIAALAAGGRVLADLLANDSDPDGDTMTIVGLSETSTNGALMDRDTTFIYYTPRETNTGVGDQF